MTTEIRDDFGDVIRLMGEATDEAAEAMAAEVYEESQRRVPYVEGYRTLQKSGRIEHDGNGKARVMYGGPEADHAGAVEFKPGIKYRHGREGHFLRNSLMATAKRQTAAAARAFRKVLTR